MAIPGAKQAGRVIHLDTDVLLDALGAFDGDQDLHDAARRLLYDDKAQAEASFPVLGEAVHVLCSRDKELTLGQATDVLRTLFEHIRKNRITTCGFGSEEAAVGAISSELREAETRLQPTDAIIIATGCVNHAQKLYTTDKYAEWSRTTEIAAKHGLKITHL